MLAEQAFSTEIPLMCEWDYPKALMWLQAPPIPCPPIMPQFCLGRTLILQFALEICLVSILKLWYHAIPTPPSLALITMSYDCRYISGVKGPSFLGCLKYFNLINGMSPDYCMAACLGCPSYSSSYGPRVGNALAPNIISMLMYP